MRNFTDETFFGHILRAEVIEVAVQLNFAEGRELVEGKGKEIEIFVNCGRKTHQTAEALANTYSVRFRYPR